MPAGYTNASLAVTRPVLTSQPIQTAHPVKSAGRRGDSKGMPLSCRTRSLSSWPSIEPLESRRLHSRTYVVTNTTEYNHGSLYAGVMQARAGDTIDARGVSGTITLPWTTRIETDLILLGPGADRLTVKSTGGLAFDVDSGLNVAMSGFRFDGLTHAASGGALRLNGELGAAAGTLTLDDMSFTNNVAANSGGAITADHYNLVLRRTRFAGNTAVHNLSAAGGALLVNNGSVTAIDCTFDSNKAHAVGGSGVTERTALGGAVVLMNAAASTFTNCTFAYNAATADQGGPAETLVESYGGAIALFGNGDFTMTNCTVVNNTAGGNGATGFGGGVNVFAFGAVDVVRTDTLKIANTVIAENTAAVGPDAFGMDVYAPAISNYKNNVIGNGDYSGFAGGSGNGNRVGTPANPIDPKLNGLTDNGGPVPTMMPQGGSPLLGVAHADETPRRDARGYPRSTAYDVGAVERQSNYSPGLTVWPDTVAAAGLPFGTRVAADDVDGNDIAFTLKNGPAWLTLTDAGDGTATLGGTPTVDDGGVARVTVRASDGLLSWDETFDLNVNVWPVTLSDDGLLRVAGTLAGEVIRVWQPRGSGTAIRAAVGKRSWNFAVESVKSIQIFALGGDDVVVGNPVDLGVYVNAGDGDDTVVGGEMADSLTAAAGDDQVFGMGGADWIDGNSGRDVLDAGDGDDRVYGGNGRDQIDGGVGHDVLYGEVGPDLFITQDRARDWIFGGEPDINYVRGDEGRDILYDAVAIR